MILGILFLGCFVQEVKMTCVEYGSHNTAWALMRTFLRESSMPLRETRPRPLRDQSQANTEAKSSRNQKTPPDVHSFILFIRWSKTTRQGYPIAGQCSQAHPLQRPLQHPRRHWQYHRH